MEAERHSRVTRIWRHEWTRVNRHAICVRVTVLWLLQCTRFKLFVLFDLTNEPSSCCLCVRNLWKKKSMLFVCSICVENEVPSSVRGSYYLCVPVMYAKRTRVTLFVCDRDVCNVALRAICTSVKYAKWPRQCPCCTKFVICMQNGVVKAQFVHAWRYSWYVCEVTLYVRACVTCTHVLLHNRSRTREESAALAPRSNNRIASSTFRQLNIYFFYYTRIYLTRTKHCLQTLSAAECFPSQTWMCRVRNG